MLAVDICFLSCSESTLRSSWLMKKKKNPKAPLFPQEWLDFKMNCVVLLRFVGKLMNEQYKNDVWIICWNDMDRFTGGCRINLGEQNAYLTCCITRHMPKFHSTGHNFTSHFRKSKVKFQDTG